MSRDTIFATPLQSEPFQFDDRVASVFADMIKRSVPGYGMIIDMTAIIARRYVKAGTRCYDLGCSLGASTLAMRHGIAQPGCAIIAIDNSPAMVDRCRDVIQADQGAGKKVPITVLCDDVCNVHYANASMITMNFTLQFIAAEKRATLLQQLHDALVPGGALILSEKIAFDDAGEQGLLTDLHHDFKATQGYSQLEIAQKRQALDNVLIPDTVAAHKARLHAAGFSQVNLWFQCFNFCSMIAIK